MDVFVLTSLWEGLPISVLEAMASGRPVVATDTGGIAEAVTEGRTGFLVPPRSIEDLSQKVVFLLKEKSLREEIGKNCPVYLAEKFSWDEAVKAHCRLYL
jgi:glycosyltransferase involved in cell wall biosynthesis